MIKDRVKFYEDYSEFNPCTFCHKSNHLLHKCPKLFYIPDKDFHIKKFNYSPQQSRKTGTRTFSSKKRLNALKNITKIQGSMQKLLENVSLEDIPEIEEEGPLSLQDFSELEVSKIDEEIKNFEETEIYQKDAKKKDSVLSRDMRKELTFDKKPRKKTDYKLLEETNENVIGRKNFFELFFLSRNQFFQKISM